MKTIAIVGTRSRNSQEDLDLCEIALFEIYEEGDSIVSGGCPRGGDRFAEIIAMLHDIPIKIHKPDWSVGRNAGFLRNTLIAEDADVVIAVVQDKNNPHFGGTGDTIKKAEKMGKKIILV